MHQKSMEKLANNRTTIVIAHRLSTIKDTERILVLDKGKIVEQETHNERIGSNSIYLEHYNVRFEQ